MNTSLSLHYPGTEDEVRKQRSESNTADIRKEIEPVATTVCRTIFLQKFDCSAHQDRAQDGSDPSMPQHIVVYAMDEQELDPQHTGQAGIHTEMSHFVYPHDFSDLQRRRFKEREIDHHCDNRQGDRIFLQVIQHHYYSIQYIQNIFRTRSIPAAKASISSFVL